MTPAVRLQRAIAEAGLASRRGADALIAAGRVRVDGRPAVVGERVDPGRQRIEVDGRAIPAPVPFAYLAVSKPAGVTSTVRDRHARSTVLELVSPHLAEGARLYPVGRLDRGSEGLLLLTNDGALTERLLHPRHAVEREYAVALGAPLTATQEAQLMQGIELEEGSAALRGLRPATPRETGSLARLLSPAPRRGLSWYRVVLGQGRKRQIRRMFAAVGARVERLVRVRFGPIGLEGLVPGEVRPLTDREVADLHRESGGPLGEPGAEPRGARRFARRSTRRGLVVALDGPGSSGKSSVGAAAAAAVGYRFGDTGLLYRAVTWLALAREVPTEDGARLAELVDLVELEPDEKGALARVVVEGRDVTAKVASARVDRSVSAVARQPEVRRALLQRQRSLSAGGGVVLAGRDIGTVVLPDADLKLYLDASVEERARRRVEQRGLDPGSPAAARILAELRRRDRIDATRPVAPLRPASDAVVIRTDGNTLGQTVDTVVAAIRRRERESGP